jgi:putative transposase
VLNLLNSQRFADQAPREVFATLLDEGTYWCSWRQMYRILEENELVQERRNQLRHPTYTKPELVALRPNTVWSWDITKLLGPQTWTYFYLYVILDIFSRYVVGWMIADHESADLARTLVAETCAKQAIPPGQLTLHADRGAAMVSHTLAQLLAELGVSKSHSRPYTSNDNPFSEAQFKTTKYRPDYPDRFASEADALKWARVFFPWYNNEHHHTGLALLTPADVHFGRAEAVIAQRQQVLREAYARHPERFVKGEPIHPPVPTQVWINPPKSDSADSVDPKLVH